MKHRITVPLSSLDDQLNQAQALVDQLTQLAQKLEPDMTWRHHPQDWLNRHAVTAADKRVRTAKTSSSAN